ncbi:DNA-binding SARP family transcriptional activator [Herbihabitans rhizosphaerae]|uniref:DNA-binding SARP family transcriptional activator n=1 Tax=Herbihabitans rhizosphaerae TaxID=1872711 RepID=A0A4Q7KKK6_9PSEU|nr:BTAD domain-containing putative transcriptional regulator [Herbihabitans rhizosphaerae]RZS36410.1 DNA-binding SARP family transcriptional activator [Herbihabitans rhizosphaerae]
MIYRVLGPLELRDRSGAPVGISGDQLRSLLSVLLARAGSWVELDTLIDALWGEAPPASARRGVKHKIWQLRQVLTHTGTEAAVEGRPGAYRLVIGRGELDSRVFTDAIASARTEQARGDHAAAVETFTRALDLWRGEPFASLGGTAVDFAAPEAARLTELRWDARDGLTEALLALDRTSEAIGILRACLSEDPLREPLWCRLMEALHRADRRAEALNAFAHARRVLVDELGMEPGPDMRRLHERILLTEDEEPTAEATTQRSANFLPPEVSDFTGRGDELRDLRLRAATHTGEGTVPLVVVVDGTVGVGKTSFALHAAHLLAGEFPDAQLHVDLRGHRTGRGSGVTDALRTLLDALGTPSIADGQDARTAQWRARMAGRRAIVLLDDVTDVDQVRALLPASGSCLVLVTSRHRLSGLDGAHTITLSPMPESDSVALLSRVLDDERARDTAALAGIAAKCGHLPLAVRVAGNRLRRHRQWTLEQFADRLAANPLDELRTDDIEVAARIEASYLRLDDPAQRMFRLLGVCPVPEVDTLAAAALAGVREQDAERLLERLAEVHLVSGSGRYRMPELVRSYAGVAARRDESGRRRKAAIDRVLDFYLHATTAVADRLDRESTHRVRDRGRTALTLPDVHTRKQARTWLAAEHPNVVAAQHYAAEHGQRTHAKRLAELIAVLAPLCAIQEAAPIERGRFVLPGRYGATGSVAAAAAVLAAAAAGTASSGPTNWFDADARGGTESSGEQAPSGQDSAPAGPAIDAPVAAEPEPVPVAPPVVAPPPAAPPAAPPAQEAKSPVTQQINSQLRTATKPVAQKPAPVTTQQPVRRTVNPQSFIDAGIAAGTQWYDWRR